MNLMNRKMHIFCVSNIMISFICTGFINKSYAYDNLETPKDTGHEIVATDDVDPLSQKGEENNSTKVVIEVSNVEEKNTKTVKTTSTTKAKVTKVVSKKEVKSKVVYTPAKYNAVTGNAIVDYAKKYLGLRYNSGLSLTTGTDCSGFTKLIFQEFGVKLGRTVSSQTKSGSYVRKSDLQKGDLVFYSKGGSKATHVAIYIGSGKVIHESTYKYGVKISSVNMMHYVTARRVINNTANKIASEKQKENTASNVMTLDNNTNNSENVVNVQNNVVANNNTNNSNVEVIKEEKSETVKEESNNVNNEVKKEENTNTEVKKESVDNTTSNTNTASSQTNNTTKEVKNNDSVNEKVMDKNESKEEISN